MRRRLAFLVAIAGCAGSVDTGPPAPRILPDRIVLSGFAPIQIGERFDSRGFRRLAGGEQIGPFTSIGSWPLFVARPDSHDSLEQILVRTAANGRVRCVSIQHRQTYPAAFDSLSGMLSGHPVWADSSGASKQAVWTDNYVRWWVGGSWVPRVVPVTITVIAVEPPGKPFDINDLELC